MRDGGGGLGPCRPPQCDNPGAVGSRKIPGEFRGLAKAAGAPRRRKVVRGMNRGVFMADGGGYLGGCYLRAS